MSRTALLVMVAAIASCNAGTVDDVRTRKLGGGGTVRDLQLIVPRGRALAFVAQPMEGQETLKQDIALESRDETVAKIYGTEEMNQFVVVGVANGSTSLDVIDSTGGSTGVEFTVSVTP